MVNLFKRQKDSLIVSCLEDVVFLHPPPTSSPASNPPLSPEELAAQEPSSHDPILRGQVTLVTQSARKARRIRVELVGRCTRHGGDGSHNYEASATLEKSLEIDLQGERLEAGAHTWDFSFIIPSSTAVGERSNYGTVRHSIRATLHGVGNFRDLTSMPKPIYLIANPAPPGDLPSGLEIDVRHPTDELGPLALHVSSPHLTVASLLFMSVTFENPPDGLKIMSVQAFVRQEFEIHYSASEIPVSHPPVQRKLLFYADSSTGVPSSTDDLLDRSNLSRGAPPPLAYEPRSFLPQPLARLQGGKEWQYARVTRIPDDDLVRPTTLDGTETPIRVAHQLVCQVRYRFKGSKKDQVLEMASGVTIASCCCLTSSLLLPTYRQPHHPSAHSVASTQPSSLNSSVSPTPNSRSRSSSPSPALALSALAGGLPVGVDTPSGQLMPLHRRCLCNTPTQQLVDEDGERLCGVAASQSRSRSRVPRGRDRSGSDLRYNAAPREGDDELSSACASEDEGAEGAGGRGRDRRRKIGETFPVRAEPETAALHGIEELPPVPGASWEAQRQLLLPLRPRPGGGTVQAGTAVQRVAAGGGSGSGREVLLVV